MCGELSIVVYATYHKKFSQSLQKKRITALNTIHSDDCRLFYFQTSRFEFFCSSEREEEKKNKETRAARNVYAHNKHRERGDWKLPEASVNSRWLDTPESLSDRQRMLKKKKKKNKTPFFLKNIWFEKYIASSQQLIIKCCGLNGSMLYNFLVWFFLWFILSRPANQMNISSSCSPGKEKEEKHVQEGMHYTASHH